MTTNAAKICMNTMILPHIMYCLTSWGHGNHAKPIESLYKTIKTLDQKPQEYHHCNILKKHILPGNWELGKIG